MKWPHSVSPTLFIFFASQALASSPSAEASKDSLNRIESIIQRAKSLGRVAAIPIATEDSINAQTRLFGVSGDQLRAQNTLNRAVEHLILNDNQRALDVAERGYLANGETNRLESDAFLKVIYEAHRKLENYKEASSYCVRFISRGVPEPTLVLSCSHTLYKASERSLEGSIALTRQTLNAFAYSQAMRSMKTHALQSATLISKAYENLDQKLEAHDYLQRAIAGASDSDSWLARAKYIVALQELRLGQTEKSQKALLAISRSQDSDKLTQVMAKHSLARLLTQSAQYDAAEQFYKEAIALSETMPPEPAARQKPVGTFAFGVPGDTNTSFSFLKREKLLSEYAANLCARGKFEECNAVAEKLPNTTPMQSHSELLLRSGVFRKKSQNRIAAILGSSQTDLAFIREQQRIDEQLSLESLSKRARALTLLAESYGTEATNLKRLLEICRRAESATDASSALRENLTRAISSWTQKDAPNIDARLVESQKELHSLAIGLLDIMRDIRSQSYSHWNTLAGGFIEAQHHDAALLARASALFDAISDISAGVQQRQQKIEQKSLTDLANNAAVQGHENQARIGALHFWGALSPQPNLKEKTLAVAQEAVRLHVARSEVTWQTQLENLKSHTMDARDVRLSRLEQTLAELSALHARRFRAPQNTAEQESLKQVRNLWAKLLVATKELGKVETKLRSQSNASRSQLLERALSARKKIDHNAVQTQSVQDALHQEMKRSVVKSAQDLYRPARSFHDRLRIAIADSDLFALESTEAGQEKLARAAEERRHWIDSLRQTNEWELGR
jgi:hypothetical protein